LALDALAKGVASDVLNKVAEAAKSGDMRACELLLSRVWPALKSRPVSLDLPKLEKPADLVAALSVVAAAVGRGQVTPDEGQAVAALLETKRRAIETADIEARLSALEKQRK
jgi:hypothetical protein